MDDDKVIQKLHTLPTEIIEHILSYIEGRFLMFLLGYEQLEPHVLRAMCNHKVMTIGYRSDPTPWLQIRLDETMDDDYISTSAIDCELAVKHSIFPKEITLFETQMEGIVNDRWIDRAATIAYRGWASERDVFVDDPEAHNQFSFLAVKFRDKVRQFNILRKHRETLTEIRFQHSERFTWLISLQAFPVLKSLRLASANQNIFNILPPSLETLYVIRFAINRNVTAEDRSAAQLKELYVFINKNVQKLGQYVARMTNLKKLEIESSTLVSVQDLQLPLSMRLLVFCKCVKLKNYRCLSTLPRLRHLVVAGSDFPLELFEDENKLPLLTYFKYYQQLYRFRNRFCRRLDMLRVPINMQELVLCGNCNIVDWVLPPRLRVLSLYNIDFANPSFKLALPKELISFGLFGCRIKTLDNVQFPTGLQELYIMHNMCLASVAGTNIEQLENLWLTSIAGNQFDSYRKLVLKLPRTAPKGSCKKFLAAIVRGHKTWLYL
ncbi:hypothetical protein Cantr_02440 [Candida viswanathii]|uniref:F-box domain-containing protein n=1 Tax=Candida viswanathii TaxID=5486 RepID=A0A367YS88_9ASCO|nr:hypothetical protein Cantr_02440 [Candida viswanathii]